MKICLLTQIYEHSSPPIPCINKLDSVTTNANQSINNGGSSLLHTTNIFPKEKFYDLGIRIISTMTIQV